MGSINVKPVAIGSRVSGRTKHSARLPDQMCKRTTSNIGPGFVIMHQFFYITNRHHGAPIQVNVHTPEQTNTSIKSVAVKRDSCRQNPKSAQRRTMRKTQEREILLLLLESQTFKRHQHRKADFRRRKNILKDKVPLV